MSPTRKPGAASDHGPPDAASPWLFPGPLPAGRPARHRDPALPEAVLLDRDGTLVEDVPYNGDPERVRPLPGAGPALAALRGRGIAVGVVSNQSGVARGLLTRRRLVRVQQRIESLLGPFGVWAVCPHAPADGCGCRKPAPGLVLAACGVLGADPRRTVVIGDIGADVEAALAAGAQGILVPTAATLPRETAAAPRSAPDLESAVGLLLGRSATVGPRP
ncbi:D-glycero-alpha-D-manno-heptose-1,7-bisphosphate 7-phosphatase [Peterkaempfera griseoplana]|uniref:D-glycero-alpha-D-manno-heptose-1,7-bisphosphate 7-phosphatase n=1 Tax=Peterkaempfera griseoplana TaxID=66896 RepID=UPI0006E17B9A|nr:HAD-IIIA family hydrolase [Peterkaempfera griseoplana]